MDDCGGELISGGEASEVAGSNFSVFEDFVDRGLDLGSVLLQPDVLQHLGSAQKHGSWIGDVFT